MFLYFVVKFFFLNSFSQVFFQHCFQNFCFKTFFLLFSNRENTYIFVRSVGAC